MIMNKYAVRKLILLLVALIVVLACEVPFLPAPAASNPAPPPGSIETIVVATAGAAQTQTAQAQPSPTITETSTPLPTFTPTETLTATPTVIFIIPTATDPYVSPTASADCQILAQVPANNTTFASREKFKMVWEVKNTSTDYWLNTDVDFKYTGGTDMHGADAIDLPVTVAPGADVTLAVNMRAPKNSGSYTSNWSVGSKKNSLCKVSITIVVK
jgi:hypothetical protein